MIAQLTGSVVEIEARSITLDVKGVGYEVFCTRACRQNLVLKQDVTLWIYSAVREGDIRLFGFVDALEKTVFRLLIQVSGVGPKIGSEILSQIEKTELLRAIARADVARLQGIKGVGKKTAERIVVELKDRVGEFAAERLAENEGAPASSQDALSKEAIAALQALGFPRREAERAVLQAVQGESLSGLDVGTMVKAALRFV